MANEIHDQKLQEAVLGVYRISPGPWGWASELFTTPIVDFLLLGTLAWIFDGSRPYALWIATIPAVLAFAPNVTFLLSTILQSRTSRNDILYLRNYAKPSIVEHGLTREPGALQLIVRGILRPPYDIVSLFPPPSCEEEKRAEVRLRGRRGIHHVFTLRTRRDEDWKLAIECLLVSSKLVLVECYCVSGGFAWELERIPAVTDADKVILIADEGDRKYVAEIERLLVSNYRERGVAIESLPIIVHEWNRKPAVPFDKSLIAMVRKRAPYTDEFVSERAKPIAVEIVLKTSTLVLTFIWWLSLGASVLAIIVLAIKGAT